MYIIYIIYSLVEESPSFMWKFFEKRDMKYELGAKKYLVAFEEIRSCRDHSGRRKEILKYGCQAKPWKVGNLKKNSLCQIKVYENHTCVANFLAFYDTTQKD